MHARPRRRCGGRRHGLNTIGDLLSLTRLCVSRAFEESRSTMLLVVLLGVCLGVASWYLMGIFVRLWNRQFTRKPVHHSLSFFAGMLTVVFTVQFVALNQIGPLAITAIEAWRQQALQDEEFSGALFVQAYEQVREANHEPPEAWLSPETRHPREGGTKIPSNAEESQEITATVYVQGSAKHFRETRPYLGWLLRPETSMPRDAVVDEMQAYFAQNPGGTFELRIGLRIAASMIEADLLRQVPLVVSLGRMALGLAFLLVQGLIFAVVAWAAYNDIRIIT